jgi:hypothetical protein
MSVFGPEPLGWVFLVLDGHRLLGVGGERAQQADGRQRALAKVMRHRVSAS